MQTSDEKPKEQKKSAAIDQLPSRSFSQDYDAYLPERHKNMPNNAIRGKEWKDAFFKIKDKLLSGFIMALLGDRGTGKTQLAVKILQLCCWKEGVSCRYAKAKDIFMDVRATYDGHKNESAVIRKYAAYTVLVIDEAHERGETAWEDGLLTYLVDVRYDAKRDTIFISNLSQEAFIKSVGPSIASRIQEAGGIMLCDWPSYRDKTV